MIIDTHCHLDNEKYSEDLEEVLNRASDSGVGKFIIPGADPKDLEQAIQLSEKYSNIYFAIGIHPYHVDDWNSSIFQYIDHPKCVAVGECGLDYFRLPKDKQEREENISKQKEIFKKQIQIAKEHKKPLIVHIRDAGRDAKEILLEENEIRGVLHCFNGDTNLLDLANHNFYFGIGGVVTFKNGKKLVNSVPLIPREKILVETDAPYLTPHPYRGTRNEPSYTTLVVEKLGELLNMGYDEVVNLTRENSEKLFQI